MAWHGWENASLPTQFLAQKDEIERKENTFKYMRLPSFLALDKTHINLSSYLCFAIWYSYTGLWLFFLRRSGGADLLAS